jgi:sulfonate transport system substrate-binding protein
MTLTRLLAAVVALAFAAPAASADEIRLATQPMPHYAPIFLAKQKKWLDEELAKVKPGIEVTWSSFAAGPPINESFAAGQQDFGFLGDTPALIGKSAGIDTKVVGLTSSGPKTLAVVVGAASAVTDPKDLKGRKVAVTKGSYAQHLLALVLQKGGLTLSDIELVNLPNADIVPALLAGAVDAGAVWEPVISRFTAQKAIKVLADGTGIKKGVLLIVGTSDFVARKPDQTRALLRAYARGADYIRANPKEAAELVAEDTKLPADLLARLFADFDFNPVIRADDVTEIKGAEAYLRSIGLLKAPVDVDAWLDRSLITEAK